MSEACETTRPGCEHRAPRHFAPRGDHTTTTHGDDDRKVVLANQDVDAGKDIPLTTSPLSSLVNCVDCSSCSGALYASARFMIPDIHSGVVRSGPSWSCRYCSRTVQNEAAWTGSRGGYEARGRWLSRRIDSTTATLAL
jgi:hypothetical protein